ncbi:MAG: DUF401 family protein [Spirochaetes bacterium]|nr:DUF401 family protein [Spirochaetota bacterium]
MELLTMTLALPATVKIGTVFLLILVFNRVGIPLSWSIVINAVILGIWTDGAISASLRWQLQVLSGAESIMLALAIVLLLFFTESLNQSGRMERTIHSLKATFKNPKLLLAGLPALVGLLPMPGGAIFSAPMVESLDDGKLMHGTLKTAVNYWFRHIWEYWWPLYPGVILAMKYSGLPVPLFIAIQAPLTLFAVTGGTLFILSHVKTRKVTLTRTPVSGDAAAALVPIGILVACALAGSYILPRFSITGSLASLCAMIFGLVLSLSIVFISSPASFPRSLGIFKKQPIWDFVVLVIGVTLFSAALKRPLSSIDVTLVGVMRDEFIRFGIPLTAVMIAVPFISGMVTGVAMGFVGASFPLVFALIGPHPVFRDIAALTVLAYGSGYIGMMLSPIHICFVVTNEYFKSNLLAAYRYVLPAAGVVALGVAACTILYRGIF